MGYAITSPAEKPRRRTTSSSQKTASGDFFTLTKKTSLENLCNPLKPRQGNAPTPTKTASGVHFKNYLDHVYAVSNDNGNIVEHYRYTAFGEPEIYTPTGAKLATSAIDNTVLWNSRRYDADTNLYYYKYRHYKADIGRWLSRDPIEENSGNNNLYDYCYQSPLNWLDQLGHSTYGQGASNGGAVGSSLACHLGARPPTEPCTACQLAGYPSGTNMSDYFRARFPNFLLRATIEMMDEVEAALKEKCSDMPDSGELEDELYIALFTSQWSHDARLDRDMPANPVTEHPNDIPQGEWEGRASLGQFTVASKNVTYSGFSEIGDCKCAIEWDGVLSIRDTPGTTTSEDGWLGNVLGCLGVPVNSPPIEIASISVGGYICCDE